MATRLCGWGVCSKFVVAAKKNESGRIFNSNSHLQEQLDDLYRRTKMESTPKCFRAKLLQLLEEHVEQRFRCVTYAGHVDSCAGCRCVV